MGYYVSTMIGIRTGGVFSGNVDLDHLKSLVSEVIAELQDTEYSPDMGDDPTHCMSRELTAHKGCYVVLAGVFNYWMFKQSKEFARRLSEKTGTEVMIMSWDEEINTLDCNVFLGGKPLSEVPEHPVGRILRRVAR